MKKFRVVLPIILAMFMLVMAACSNANSNQNQSASSDNGSEISGTVRVGLVGWQLDNGVDTITGKKNIGFNQFLNETFKKKFPKVKLQITNAPWEKGLEKHQAMLLTKDVDVLYTGGSWATEWYKQGLLRSIDDLIASDPTFKKDDYIDGTFDGYTVKSLDDKNIFGIPAIAGKRMIVYDKKLFDQWGVAYLSETPTPEEILEKAKKMTGKNPVTGEQNYGVYAVGNSRMIPHYLSLMYYYNAPGVEGSLADNRNLKWKMNTPEMVKVLEWLKEASPLMPKAFVNGAGAEKFGQENNDIAIQLDGSGNEPWGQFKSSGNKDALNRFIPVLNMGPKGAGWAVVDPIVMAKDAKNLKASWEVMKFLASYERQKYSYENFDWTPVTKNVDFIDPNDAYAKKALDLLKISPQKRLMDEANLFYASEISPAVNGFMSRAANGEAPDIQPFLDDLQKRAEKWSASSK